MTEEKVREIRADMRPNAAVAAEHGISAAAVSDIRRRKSWAHVE